MDDHEQEILLADIQSRWVSVIHRLKERFLDRELAEVNLGGSTFMYLVVLMQRQGLRQEEFCRLFHLDKGTVARALSKLEAIGYIARRPDPADRRAHCVEITEAGRAVIPQVYSKVEILNGVLLEGLSEDKRQLAKELLHTMSENLTRRLNGH